VRMRDDWKNYALCADDEYPFRWLSSSIDDINYAKEGCMKCSVRIDCLHSAIYEREEFVGVNGGYSEIEYLIRTWERAEVDDETNWRKSDKLIQDLFREIS